MMPYSAKPLSHGVRMHWHCACIYGILFSLLFIHNSIQGQTDNLQNPIPSSQINSNSSAFSDSSFFQYLTEQNPTVKNVKFRKEVFLFGIPADARVQIFQFKIVGDNCLLGVLHGTNNAPSAYYGIYKNISWQFLNGIMTYSDPALNNTDTPVSSENSIVRITENLVINLGITELDRRSLIWDGQNGQFLAKSTDGKDMIIGFQPIEARPNRAIIRRTIDGNIIGYIDYQYSSSVCNGDLPSSFVRHVGSPSQDLGKSFSVEIFDLNLSTDNFNVSALNPKQLFHTRYGGFYSNNILWSTKDSGSPTKVMTAEEYQAFISALPKPKKSIAVRIIVLSILAFGLICALVLVGKQIKQTNRIKTYEQLKK